MRHLLTDTTLLHKVGVHVRPERFPDPAVRRIIEEVVTHYKQHGERPTGVVVLQRLQYRVDDGKLTNEDVQASAEAMEKAWDSEEATAAYCGEAILKEARTQAMFTALDLGLRTFRGGDFDKVAEQVERAASIGKATDNSPGVDIMQALAERTKRRRAGTQIPRLGTGIGDLDDVIRGGLAAGELGTVIGAPKYGKSQFLNTVAYHVLSLGGTVFYYSLEMGEADLVDRMDAAISRTPIDLLQEKADFVNEAVGDWLSQTKGRMLVKQFPSYKTTVSDLEMHTQMLSIERGLEPTMLIVDSADFCGVKNAGRDSSRYEALGQVYSELRGMAVTWQCPMWTATWANRESLEKKVVTMGDIAESFKKAGIADLGVAICGSEEERQSGILRLYTAFCRFASAGVMLGPYKNNYEMGLSVKGSAGDDDDFPV